jgi:hypothetical protein
VTSTTVIEPLAGEGPAILDRLTLWVRRLEVYGPKNYQQYVSSTGDVAASRLCAAYDGAAPFARYHGSTGAKLPSRRADAW